MMSTMNETNQTLSDTKTPPSSGGNSLPGNSPGETLPAHLPTQLPMRAAMPTHPCPPTRPLTRLNRLVSRLGEGAKATLLAANTPTLAVASLLALAATLLILLLAERSVLTGLCILSWGAGACILAYREGKDQRVGLDAKMILCAYAALTLLLFVLLNGLYRLMGI